MQALRFERFGAPAVLKVTETPDPVGSPQEAVIRVEAASVNPSDVKNVAGPDGINGIAAHTRA